jgi:hypothetical protein
MDFTNKKYEELCKKISKSDYHVFTIEDFLKNQGKNLPKKFIILRHDVDRFPKRSLSFAIIEHRYNIKSTYYFRNIKNVFKPNIILKIKELKHEIGYHYECLDESKGNVKKAITIFKNNLDKFSKLAKIQTICMHGNSISKWDNRDIWKHNKFEDYNIIGEPYLSIDYSDILYLSDTSRNWDTKKLKIKDIVDSNVEFKIRSTNDIIDLIDKKGYKKIALLIHPDSWTDNKFDWSIEFLIQSMKNIIKRMFKLLK